MLFHSVRPLSYGFRLLLCSLQQSDSLPFSGALTEGQIEAAFDEQGVPWRRDDEEVFTPAMTLWAFVGQTLFKEEQRSCLAAVARIGVMLLAMGRPRCAQNSGPYCRARGRLPVAVIERLTLDAASRCEAEVSEKWLWKGRHVKLADGTSVSMPDTEANQEAFPQQTCQKKGLGFPIARLVVLLSLATGMTSGMAMGPYAGKETGELSLLGELSDQLDEGDVFLADKLYCTYFLMAMLLQRKVDVVVSLHQARKIDRRQIKRLGKHDCLITWQRPGRPSWMDRESYDQMPKSLELRLVHVDVDEPGFRTQSLDVVTTLRDANRYSRDEIAELYHRRWLAELDIRSIKCTLGMDCLRCKSPPMVRKEIWTCLLAYNLIRQKMLQAALQKNVSPRRMSFANTMQVLAAGWMVMPLLDRQTRMALVRVELRSVASQIVGNRPGRVEPRAVKRRPKPYRLLTMARRVAQALLRQGIDPYQKQR
jgi:putative transposase